MFALKNVHNVKTMNIRLLLMISWENNNSFNICLVIGKTTEFGQIEKTDITSARLLIESEKLALAVDEFPKRLKGCT